MLAPLSNEKMQWKELKRKKQLETEILVTVN